MEYKHQLIICIVDEGYSDNVMDVAKECGARGGTVVHAKGTANKEAERYFNIAIHPNKEMVMILIPTSIRDSILHALYTKVGLNTQGHGIAFALPVDNVVGLRKTVEAPLVETPSDTIENKQEAQTSKETAPDTAQSVDAPNTDPNDLSSIDTTTIT